MESIRGAMTGKGTLATQSVKECTGSATPQTIKRQLLDHL